jgi:tetratricopeptide (TPR) repeat protein
MITKKFRHILPLSLSLFFYLVAQTGPAFAKDHSAGEKMIRDLNDQIVAANERRDLPAALQAAEKAVQVAKTEFGENSLEAADTMNNLANLYLYLKRAAEAEQIYKQAVLIDLVKLDREGVEMAAIYFNLGVAYAMQKKYTDAINILNKALNIRLKKLGRDDPATKNVEQMIAELTSLAYPKTEKI